MLIKTSKNRPRRPAEVRDTTVTVETSQAAAEAGEKFRERLQKRMESDPEYQRRKGMTQTERNKEAIDFMTKDSMRIDTQNGAEASEESHRNKMIEVAERNDLKSR